MGQPTYVVKINNKAKKFRDLNGIFSFLNEEKEYWSWLSTSNVRFSMLQDLYRFSYTKPLESVRSRASALPEGESFEDELGGNDFFYIEASSPEGKLIDRARKEHGAIVAAFALYYLSENRLVKISAGDAVSFQAMLGFERERALGATIAHSLIDVKGMKNSAAKDAAFSLYEKFQEEYQLSVGSIRRMIEEAENDAASSRVASNNQHVRQARRFERRLYRYKGLLARVTAGARREFTGAVEDVAAAKAAYHDNVDLAASVTYWASRETYHKEAKKNAFLGVVFGMFFMFVVVAFYYGMSGISKQFHMNEPVKTSQATVSDMPETNVPKSKEASSAVEKLAQDAAVPAMATFVIDMVGAVLLLTIFGTLIRLGLRQFNIHSQMELDAAEKITLTKTYLALLGENKLDSAEDRRLVLEGIFRASNPNVAAAEAAFSTPIELVLKSIKQN
ncbi:hypothetical protein [Pseudomonas sp. FGI182]|uniref:hypothetical protein n=1 Tax=Pseudomonas sp. FGI182 TaxID=1259844 RepID=UPI0004295B18|nr:hypothetical protein [Pseudomonas sp. FGI182]